MLLSQTELFRCIQTFEPDEYQSFALWLNKAAGAKGESLRRFWTFLELELSKKRIEQLDWMQVHKAIYADKTFKVQRVRDLMSLLYAAVKDFLCWQELQESSAEKNSLLLRQFRKRGLDKAHGIHLRKWKGCLEMSDYRDHHWFAEKFYAEEEAEAIVEARNVRQPKDHLQETTNALDIYYLSRKLQALCEMQNRSKIFQRNYDFHLQTEIKSILQRSDYSHLEEACISIYYLILKTFEESEDVSHFQDLQRMIEKNVHLFPNEEARKLYRYSENYCIRKINQSATGWLKELFDIYQKLIASGLILQEDKFPHTDYKNIVTVGLRLQKNDWVKAFIDKNKDLLDENIRLNAYNYNLANYYYETDELDAVVDLLRTVDFSDLFYEISSKYILIKVYYDLKEHILLSYLLTSFERFVARNKDISTANKKAIQSFLSMTKKLNRFQQDAPTRKQEKNQARLLKVESDLASRKAMTNIKWIKDQVAHLKKSYC